MTSINLRNIVIISLFKILNHFYIIQRVKSTLYNRTCPLFYNFLWLAYLSFFPHLLTKFHILLNWYSQFPQWTLPVYFLHECAVNLYTTTPMCRTTTFLFFFVIVINLLLKSHFSSIKEKISSFKKMFYWLCYYSCPIFFSLLFPSTLYPPPPIILQP